MPTAIVNVYGSADLLPHYLTHYLGLGFERVLVGVHGDSPEVLWSEVHEHVWGKPVLVQQSYCGEFVSTAETMAKERLREEHCHPDEWVAVTDLDEFAEYPLPLTPLIREMEQAGSTCLYGELLDRVAEGGSLPEVDPVESLFRQFPWGCSITGGLLHGNTLKVMLYRGRQKLDKGHHGFLIPGEVHPHPRRGTVHHFKWNKNALNRTEDRLAVLTRQGADWAAESMVFLDYWRVNRRFDLTDPRLSAHRCSMPQVPAWNEEGLDCSSISIDG